MNAKELERVMRLGLKTVGELAQYLHLMKTNHNELQVLATIKKVY
jgi:hypothetical protein